MATTPFSISTNTRSEHEGLLHGGSGANQYFLAFDGAAVQKGQQGLSRSRTSRPLLDVRADAELLERFRAFTYWLTFVAYATSHLTRKCYTNMKVQIMGRLGVKASFLSYLDMVFMLAYAAGSVCSGMLADRYHKPTLLACGLVGSGLALVLVVLGLSASGAGGASPGFDHVYFTVLFIISGLFQSVGNPVSTAIMGNWFSSKRRGYIFGTWSCHQFVGNIAAAVVVALVLRSRSLGWVWGLLLPALLSVVMGIFCAFAAKEKPSDVGLSDWRGSTTTSPSPHEVEDGHLSNFQRALKENITNEHIFAAINVRSNEQRSSITFCEAVQIPRVASYMVAFGLFKFVNYCVFFWLPYYLNQSYSPSESSLVSASYDVGMLPGGILCGLLSDLCRGRRAVVVVGFAMALCPLLMALSTATVERLHVQYLLVLLACTGLLVGGPNSIITTAVAADIAESPLIRGNTNALGTVTGFINGVGSLIASVMLCGVGAFAEAYGWQSMWLLLVVCTLGGAALLLSQASRELSYSSRPELSADGPRRRGYDVVS